MTTIGQVGAAHGGEEEKGTWFTVEQEAKMIWPE
jgi:hypothetical protein